MTGWWPVSSRSTSGASNDIPMRQRGAKNMIDSGKLDPAKVAEFQYYLGNFAYANKDYPTAQTALAAAIAGGHPADDAAELLADSYARANDPKGGLAALRKAVDARLAAGKPVPAGWLKRANTIAYTSKLGPEAIDWAILQVQLQPSNFNWLGSSQLVRQFSGFGPQETLDLFRLMLRSGALDNEAKFVGNEYKEYVEAADPRRLPGEVVRVIDKGTAAGALSGGWVTRSSRHRQWADRGGQGLAGWPGQQRARRKRSGGGGRRLPQLWRRGEGRGTLCRGAGQGRDRQGPRPDPAGHRPGRSGQVGGGEGQLLEGCGHPQQSCQDVAGLCRPEKRRHGLTRPGSLRFSRLKRRRSPG